MGKNDIHHIHHKGSPRPDELGIMGALVLCVAAIIAFSMIMQFVVAFVQLVIVIILMLAALGLVCVAAILIWILIWHYTKFQRMKLKLWFLKWKLDGVIRQHTAGKAVAQSLLERDRALAYQQLDQVRGAGQRLRTELLKAKQSVLSNLGQLPEKKLVAKLAPFTAMEEEIDKVIQGLEFQRIGLKLCLLKWELDGVIRQHTAGKAVAQSLSERDRSLAYQQLDQVRGAGQKRCCSQVRALRTKLLNAKQSVLTKLGQLPAEKLVAKLAPFTAMEEEIDKVILGFDVATEGKSRKKLKK